MSIAIITGASSGMGKEFTLQVSKRYKFDEIWVIARRIERLEALQQEINVKIVPISLDLTNENSFAELKIKLENEKPDVKLLINCSGYGIFRKFEDITLNDNLGMIELNAKALTAVTFITLPFMSENSKIINLGSMSSFEPLPHIAVYAASKAYVLSFSRALNRELKPRKIKTLCVCPYWVQTEFFNRANTDNHIKKFDCMYTAEFVVKKSLNALDKGKKDYIVPGRYAKLLQVAAKILPHSLVMSVFMNSGSFDNNKK